VPSAPLPTADTLVEWQVFGDQQTGRLDTANNRTASSIEIVEKCEARDAEVVKALTPRTLWQKLTPW